MSALGLRVLQPYVPLHCGPSESASTLHRYAYCDRIATPHPPNVHRCHNAQIAAHINVSKYQK